MSMYNMHTSVSCRIVIFELARQETLGVGKQWQMSAKFEGGEGGGN